MLVAIAAVPGALFFVISKRTRTRSSQILHYLFSFLVFVAAPLAVLASRFYGLPSLLLPENLVLFPLLLSLMLGWIAGLLWYLFHTRQTVNVEDSKRLTTAKEYWQSEAGDQ